jgi:hypothetical protein
MGFGTRPAHGSSCLLAYVHVMFQDFAGGSPHAPPDPGPCCAKQRPRTSAARSWHRAPAPNCMTRVHRQAICPITPPACSIHPVGICPKRAEASTQSRPLASARHAPLKPSAAPLRICPIARRRARQPPPNPPDRTRRPRWTTICPITLPPAPSAPSGICPTARSTRDARKLRTVRARCNGGARPNHEEPATPPNARTTCRPDLRAPPPPCPLRP